MIHSRVGDAKSPTLYGPPGPPARHLPWTGPVHEGERLAEHIPGANHGQSFAASRSVGTGLQHGVRPGKSPLFVAPSPARNIRSNVRYACNLAVTVKGCGRLLSLGARRCADGTRVAPLGNPPRESMRGSSGGVDAKPGRLAVASWPTIPECAVCRPPTAAPAATEEFRRDNLAGSSRI
jgi:hypothetical protein